MIYVHKLVKGVMLSCVILFPPVSWAMTVVDGREVTYEETLDGVADITAVILLAGKSEATRTNVST